MMKQFDKEKKCQHLTGRGGGFAQAAAHCGSCGWETSEIAQKFERATPPLTQNRLLHAGIFYHSEEFNSTTLAKPE